MWAGASKWSAVRRSGDGLEPRNHYTAGWGLATYAVPLEHADNAAAASQVQRGTQNTIARYMYRVYE